MREIDRLLAWYWEVERKRLRLDPERVEWVECLARLKEVITGSGHTSMMATDGTRVSVCSFGVRVTPPGSVQRQRRELKE